MEEKLMLLYVSDIKSIQFMIMPEQPPATKYLRINLKRANTYIWNIIKHD